MGEANGSVYAGRYGIPVANFTAAPLMVTFTNLSTPLYGVTGYTWWFGNGTTSTLTNPLYIYAAPGVYTVALSVAVLSETHTLTRTQ